MKIFFTTTILAILLLLIAKDTKADSVWVDGIQYTCTNTCEITRLGGSILIQDCCGGTVTTAAVIIGDDIGGGEPKRKPKPRG